MYYEVWREYWNTGQVISIIASPGKTLKGYVHYAGNSKPTCSQAETGILPCDFVYFPWALCKGQDWIDSWTNTDTWKRFCPSESLINTSHVFSSVITEIGNHGEYACQNVMACTWLWRVFPSDRAIMATTNKNVNLKDSSGYETIFFIFYF